MNLDKIINLLNQLTENTIYDNHIYIVGGAVRDYVMQLPIKDVDIVVDIKNGGIDLSNYLCTTYPNICKHNTIYPTYGTAKFTLYDAEDEYEIELVETRYEFYKDAQTRNPLCEFGCSIEKDAFRRDLTINSLYLNIHTKEVIDPTKMAKNDIKNHIIRTPYNPNVIFNQDPLRILRCIRFASRYGWKIEKQTALSISKNKERLNIISAERIFDEFSKIILDKNADHGLKNIVKYRLLKYIFMGHRIYGLYNFILNNQFGLTKPYIENRLIEFFNLIDGNGHYDVSLILKKWKISNNLHNQVLEIHNFCISELSKRSIYNDTDIRCLQKNFGNKVCIIFDCLDASTNRTLGKLYQEKLEYLQSINAEFKPNNFKINGEDIMNLFNIKPSPQVKIYLDSAMEIFLENPMYSKEEIIKKVQDLFGIERKNL